MCGLGWIGDKAPGGAPGGAAAPISSLFNSDQMGLYSYQKYVLQAIDLVLLWYKYTVLVRYKRGYPSSRARTQFHKSL